MPFFRQTAPAVVLLMLGVALYMYIRQWTEIGVVGTFTLHITDPLFAVITLYCAGGALRHWRYSPLECLNLTVCGVIVLNFTRGLVGLDVAAAGVEFRNFNWFVAAGLFTYLMYGALDRDWIFDKVVLLGWGLVLLSVARLVFGLDAFIATATVEFLGEARTLNSDAALMLCIAVFIVLSRFTRLKPGSRRCWSGVTFLVFVATLLISNQRTAIVACLAGIGVIVATQPRRQLRIAVIMGSPAVVIGAVVAYGIWLATAGDITPYVPSAITMLSSDDSSYAWRINQWQDLIDLYQQAPLIDQLIGAPLGSVRFLALRSDLGNLQVMGHSEYIELLMDAGAVGVLLFVVMLISAMAKGILILKRRTGDGAGSNNVSLAMAMVTSYAVYSYTYMLPDPQGLLFALALQIIGTAPTYSRRIFRSVPATTHPVRVRAGAPQLSSRAGPHYAGLDDPQTQTRR